VRDKVENILMIRKGAIGDIIFTLPAYYMLKANFPNSKISYLVKDRYAEVLKGFPGLDEVLPINQQISASKNMLRIWEMGTELCQRIRKNNYQLAVDFAGHGEHAFLLWLSGIKHRWGSTKNKRPVREFFYTNTFIRNLNDVHIIDQHLRLLEKGGLTPFPVKNEYVVPRENLAKAHKLFADLGLSRQKTTLFIQPFTGDGVPGKRWPLDRWVMLAEYWEKQGLQVLFGGGPGEREQLREVAARFPVAAGQADFVTSVGLTALSSVVAGGDTGLLHAALAAGKRTVMVVGPTNHLRIGPYRHPEWAVLPPQGNSIMDISFEQVLEATKTAVKEVHDKK